MKLLVFLMVASFYLPARGQSSSVRWDLSKSFIAAKTGKAGKLSFLGHSHAVLATQWASVLCLAARGRALKSMIVKIPTKSLVIDTPEARKAAGMDESSLSESTRNKIQEKMLGPEILNADAYPEISFKITSPVSLGGKQAVFPGRLVLHGRSQELRIEAKYSFDGKNFEAEGQFRFLQSQFGISREKVLGGTVEVADEIEILFRLKGELLSTACAATP